MLLTLKKQTPIRFNPIRFNPIRDRHYYQHSQNPIRALVVVDSSLLTLKIKIYDPFPQKPESMPRAVSAQLKERLNLKLQMADETSKTGGQDTGQRGLIQLTGTSPFVLKVIYIVLLNCKIIRRI